MSASDAQDDPVLDETAMALCAQGHGEGLAILHRRHVRACHSLALRIVRDRHHAQDVVQEAFIEVWRHASRYDGQRATPQGWLLTLTYRKAVDRLRREAARPPLALDDRLDQPDLSAGPEAQALAHLDAQLAVTALRELPPEQAEVIVHAYWGGLSQTEIALVLGIPLGTVKTRTRRALQRLALALSPTTVA